VWCRGRGGKFTIIAIQVREGATRNIMVLSYDLGRP